MNPPTKRYYCFWTQSLGCVTKSVLIKKTASSHYSFTPIKEQLQLLTTQEANRMVKELYSEFELTGIRTFNEVTKEWTITPMKDIVSSQHCRIWRTVKNHYLGLSHTKKRHCGLTSQYLNKGFLFSKTVVHMIIYKSYGLHECINGCCTKKFESFLFQLFAYLVRQFSGSRNIINGIPMVIYCFTGYKIPNKRIKTAFKHNLLLQWRFV